MANKKTAVEHLRNYCEKRWYAQDEYISSCFRHTQKVIVALTSILLLTMTIMSLVLASDIAKLQNRVAYIEQTWSE